MILMVAVVMMIVIVFGDGVKMVVMMVMVMAIQRFAFKHKPQTFFRVCLRLKRRVCQFKRRVCRWKRECYIEVQTRLLFWAQLSCFDIGNYILHLYCMSQSTLKSVKMKPTMWYFESLKCVISHAKT